MFYKRTNYIKMDYHKVRQMVKQRMILPSYRKTSNQLAIFTKTVNNNVCEFIYLKLGLIDLS